MESDHFKDIRQDTLLKILSRDTLNVPETAVWQAAIQWAEKECSRQGKQVICKLTLITGPGVFFDPGGT